MVVWWSTRALSPQDTRTKVERRGGGACGAAGRGGVHSGEAAGLPLCRCVCAREAGRHTLEEVCTTRCALPAAEGDAVVNTLRDCCSQEKEDASALRLLGRLLSFARRQLGLASPIHLCTRSASCEPSLCPDPSGALRTEAPRGSLLSEKVFWPSIPHSSRSALSLSRPIFDPSVTSGGALCVLFIAW